MSFRRFGSVCSLFFLVQCFFVNLPGFAQLVGVLVRWADLRDWDLQQPAAVQPKATFAAHPVGPVVDANHCFLQSLQVIGTTLNFQVSFLALHCVGPLLHVKGVGTVVVGAIA